MPLQARQEDADFEEGDDAAVGPADDSQEKSLGKHPWSGSEREYDYEELLGKKS